MVSKDLKSYSNDKKPIIFMMGIPLIIGTLMFIWLYSLYPDYHLLEMYFGLWIFCICLILPYVFYDNLDKYIGSNSKIRLGATYQWSSIMSSMFYLICFVWILILYDQFGSLDSNFYVSFACIIPFVFSFFGVNVFNDSSCFLGDEIVFGYHYIYSWISLFIGLLGFYTATTLINVNFNNAVVLFVVTIIFQLLFVTPNLLNRFLPFELKTKRGFLFYTIPLLLIYVLIFYIITGIYFFNFQSLVLTPELFIRKSITWLIALVFSIVFYRQAKEMNEKKK